MQLTSLVPSLFWGHDPSRSNHNILAVLVCTGGLEFYPVFLRNNFHHLHRSRDGIPDSHRGQELDLLSQVDGPRSGENISKESGNKPNREDSMSDSSFKRSVFCIGLVEMDRIEISCR